jgi:hypothetical protein
MKVNYYTGNNFCKCCKRFDELYHIGVAAFGHAFIFRGYTHEKLESWQEWKEFLKNEQIYDEFGDRVTYSWFVNYVETYKSPNYVSEDGIKNISLNEVGMSVQDWIDAEGYSFRGREFI